MKSILRYFEFDKKNAIIKKEIVGGISTFIAMSYILAVQPSILQLSNHTLSGESLVAGNYTGALFLGVALVSFLSSIVMGVVSKVPISTAPGMGINAFFTFTVANSFKIGFEGALFCVLFSGVLYLIIACTSLRQKMMRVFPENLKIAIGTMIGLFIAYVGLSNMGIISAGVGTPTTLGSNFDNPIVIVAIVGTFLAIALHFMKVPFAVLAWLIIGIIMLAIVYASDPVRWNYIFQLKSYSDFSKFGTLHEGIWNSQVFTTTFKNPLSYIAILTFLFVNFFDASGTMFSVGKALKIDGDDMNKKGWGNWLNRANVAEGTTTVISTFFLQSSVVAYVESNTAHVMGAKTGVSSVVTGLCFLAAVVLWPILSVVFPIPLTGAADNTILIQPITGPILVLVGVMIVGQLKNFNWKEYLDIPMLLFVLAFGVLGFSISNGISWGIMMFVFLNTLVGIAELIKLVRDSKKLDKTSLGQTIPLAGEQTIKKKTSIRQLAKQTHLAKVNISLIVTSLIALLYTVVNALILANVITGF